MANVPYKSGQTVKTNEGRVGIIRYVGELHIAAGKWLGLELPDESGKNDGSVKGERYFSCKPGYGIFVREGAVEEIIKQPTINTGTRANGSANGSGAPARPRPSSGITADVARKRQSLMSNGSGSAAGSRLSLRSPTKSPTKPTSTSASSETSTPRAVTPSKTTKSAEIGNKSRLSTGGRPPVLPPSGATRPSAHTSRPSIGGSSNLRNSTTASRPSIASSRTNLSATRPSQPTRTVSKQEKAPAKEQSEPRREQRTEHVHSPTIDEEDEDGKGDSNMPNIDKILDTTEQAQDTESPSEMQPMSLESTINMPRTVSGSRAAGTGNVESRTAQQREVEQLKARIRTLENKRQEDQDKLKEVQTLEDERDRYKSIIQALQKKLRANQQELVDTRSRCEEAEARANAIPERSGELESEIELATLDREMAEERAETYQMELDALRAIHEELEVEVEVLREENAELASTMSPEEKASAGWMQMEREKDRLREALIMLRDMSQENESKLKAEIDELRDNLDEVGKTAGLYTETTEKLSRVEETNKHLMGQLEAVESNDEVVEAMEAQRERQVETIEQLKHQIQDLEESIQVTDELELFHVDEEKRLHAQLDENEALLSETQRRGVEQDRVIEDLEYTLTKFRDVVQGLQSDINELRRSRDISELQANEMSSKSRAMMDLNLRLQNNAAKSQSKYIETELNKVTAGLAEKHANIMGLFTPENFEADKKSILAFLSFGRVRSKASLVGKMLGERLRERSHLSSGEEVFRTFETMERMEWISAICHRFERFMSSCGTQDFIAYSSALAEIEPVERAVTAWIDSLKKDELANSEPENLKRMQGILMDLGEKLIAGTTETKAAEILMEMKMTENYAESLSGQFSAMIRIVQSKLGPPSDEDEESLVYDKKMDQLATKARTIKYLSSKVVQQLDGLRGSSLCMGETSWLLYEEAEQAAETLTNQVRVVGLTIAEELSKLDSEEPVSYASIPKIIGSALQQSHDGIDVGHDPFALISSRLASLQSVVDDLLNKSSNLDGTIEFESLPAPWLTRAKEIKNTKVIPPEVQDEINRLERRSTELSNKIAERERMIEEMGMRVEIAEKRFKESREKDNKDKALQEELDRLISEKQANDQTIVDLRMELVTAVSNAQTSQVELETLRAATNTDSIATAAAVGTGANGIIVDENLVKQFELEANLFQAEITSLQAAIRYLREENRNLRIPISEVLINSARNSWLSGDIARKKPTTEEARKARLEREGIDIWSGLIDVAKSVKPVRLGSTTTTNTNTNDQKATGRGAGAWQPISQTTRYAVLQQREELEKWEAWREDFVSRAKIVTAGVRTSRMRTGVGRTGVPKVDGSNLRNTAHLENGVGIGVEVRKGGDDDVMGMKAGEVKIVES